MNKTTRQNLDYSIPQGDDEWNGKANRDDNNGFLVLIERSDPSLSVTQGASIFSIFMQGVLDYT